MTKINKSGVTVGNAANANTLRDIADKMEAGKIAAYAVIILENQGAKIDVTMRSGVMEHDEGMHKALLQAMERQQVDCIMRKKQMLEPAIIVN